MGDLAKRRQARDLWISRGHVWAGAAGVVLALGISFLAGYSVGSRRAEPEIGGEATLTGAVPDDELVELLARIDASSDPTGGLGSLSFPEELSGAAATPQVPEVPAEAGDQAVVAPGFEQTTGMADPAPAGAWTVRVASFSESRDAVALRGQLRDRDVEAWQRLERVDGRAEWQVSVGGYPDERAARSALVALKANHADLAVVAGADVAEIPQAPTH